MASALKGNVPFFDKRFDLSNPTNTGKQFVSMSIGAALFVGAIAVGRTVFNRAADETNRVNSMEAF